MSKEKFYLRSGLEELGISAHKLMEDLEVSQPFISGLLNGKKAIGGTIAVKLFELYGVNPYWTLTGKGEIKNNTQKVITETESDTLNNEKVSIEAELIKIKKELKVQQNLQKKYTGQIIDYIDEYLKPVFDFMQETMEHKKKENK